MLLGTAYLVSGVFQNSLWFDEAYTVGLISNDFFEMIKLATYDVHPHLYYILLKLFTLVFGSSFIAIRLFSVLGSVLCASLGFTHIRRDFGERMGYTFTLVYFLCGSTLRYSLQMRMYTWAAYFVGLTALYAYRLYKGENSQKNQIIFCVFSILSAYTHHFALFVVCAINIALLISTIRRKEPLNNWLKLAIIQVVAYIPGAIVFLVQVLIGGASWIRVIWPDVVFNIVSYHIFGDELYAVLEKEGLYKGVGMVFLGLFVLFLLVMWKRRKEPKKYDSESENTRIGANLALVIFGATVLFSLIISLMRDIYYIRYTYTMHLLLVFAIAYVISGSVQLWKRVLAIVIMALFLIYPAYVIFSTHYDETNNAVVNEISPDIKENDVFMFDSSACYVVSAYHTSNTSYYLHNAPWPADAMRAFGKDARIVSDMDEIDFDSIDGKIYLIGKGEPYEYLTSAEDYVLTSEKSIYMKYHDYYFDISVFERVK